MSSSYNPADDPRLTAYALGELHGEDRERIEQLLQDSPEAREEVEIVREVAGRLSAELRDESTRWHAGKPATPSIDRGSKRRLRISHRALAPVMATTAAGIAITLAVLHANYVERDSAEPQATGPRPATERKVSLIARSSTPEVQTVTSQVQPQPEPSPPAEEPSFESKEETEKQQQLRRKVSAELATAQRQARQLKKNDPYQAFRILEESREQVLQAGLDSESQRQLLARVDRDILSMLPLREHLAEARGPGNAQTAVASKASPGVPSVSIKNPVVSKPTVPQTHAAIPATEYRQNVDASKVPPVAKAPATDRTSTSRTTVANTPPRQNSTTVSPQMAPRRQPVYTTTGPRTPVASHRAMPAPRYGRAYPGGMGATTAPVATAGSAGTPVSAPAYGSMPQSNRASGYGMPTVQPSMALPTSRTAGVPRAAIAGNGHSAGHAYQVDVPDRKPEFFNAGGEFPPGYTAGHTEAYTAITENDFLSPLKQPLSTFGIDVDTASYANVRRFLQQGQLPPADAVRIEEMLNYFKYDYTGPKDDKPFSVDVEATACPWNTEHRLVRVAVQGKQIARDNRPASNLVFLVDVSGSMRDENKLPLVKAGLTMLTEQMTENDRVAIVTYADSARMVLDSTGGDHKSEILAAIEQLQAGGSTNGEGGIQLAYQTAIKHFYPTGSNRVILCTDGDFNVGVSSDDQLVKLIQENATSGVFLSVFGFGEGNLKDGKMERLANRGNGVYGYVDSRREARKVFIEGLSGTLVTIAKDVKIQVEFNPAKVASYRLIGYENRALAARDFNDDKKDAGEIGAGHAVTALYEVIPAGQAPAAGVDSLKYQQAPPRPAGGSKEMLTLKLRYKQPEADTSRLMEIPFTDQAKLSTQPTHDFEWSAAIAAFGMLLRDSKHKGNAEFDLALELAQGGKGHDELGYRAECIELMKKAKALRGGR